MEEQETREGLLHMAQATQRRCIGLFRWKLDYEKAASEYAKSTLAFCRAKRLDQAMEAFLKEAEAHEKSRVPLPAAMAYEQAGLYLSRSDHLQEATQAMKQAVSWYLECGEAEMASYTLRHFTYLLESQIPHQLVCFYQWASQLFQGEDPFWKALDWTEEASRLLLRQKCYRDAVISLGQAKHLYVKEMCSCLCHQRALAQCLAPLCDLDFPAACKCLEGTCPYLPTFKFSPQYDGMVTLLSFYEDQDQDAVYQVCTSPVS
ncbi:gamma-soluble NSF attachment protein-like [Notamacropus eugenii]|uniref:gamma-soluble NSF attachment protein-like n=1 Tax=Notamacropus eugenii TaxID=9315 RepID=UPI003B67C9B4